MNKEQTLSEKGIQLKIGEAVLMSNQEQKMFQEKDVREAVKKLKARFNQYNDLGQMFTGQEIYEEIDAIFGSELSK